MKLLTFAASHRPQSINRKLAKFATAHLGAKAEFAEYTEFDMPIYNDSGTLNGAAPEVRSFGERARSSTGFIISSPEYNWSYPGSLKNIIDWTSRMEPNPLAGKTVLLMSATPGPRGGVLGLSHLKTPFEALGVTVFPRTFTLGRALDAFDAKGELADARQRTLFISLLDDYLTFARKFSPA